MAGRGGRFFCICIVACHCARGILWDTGDPHDIWGEKDRDRRCDMAWDPSVCISGRCPGCYVSGSEKMGDGEEEFCCDRFPVCADAGRTHMGRGEGVRLTENGIWKREFG